MTPVKEIFAYRDYRRFLKDYYQRGKAKGSLSARGFSRKAGLQTPNYLMLVINGKRNLTPHLAEQFAHACGLKGDAVEFFCELVAFNQAKTASELTRHYQRLIRFKPYRRLHELGAAQEQYYSKWYIPAVRELVASEGFHNDPKWIAQKMIPKITFSQAREAIKTLLRLGLLVENEQGGLEQSDPLVSTSDGPLSHQLVNYHRTMMKRASEAIERVPREQREISSVTLCIDEKQVAELKKKLENLRLEIVQTFETQPTADRIVQVNFQMFPLSQSTEDES